MATPDTMVNSFVGSPTSTQHIKAIEFVSWTGCETKTWLICCQSVAAKGQMHHCQPSTMDSFPFVKVTVNNCSPQTNEVQWITGLSSWLGHELSNEPPQNLITFRNSESLGLNKLLTLSIVIEIDEHCGYPPWSCMRQAIQGNFVR